MREPLWEALHWALLASAGAGAGRRPCAAALDGTAIAVVLLSSPRSGALIASPRRILTLLPLTAALAGVGAVWLWNERRELLRLGRSRSDESPAST